jgi:hypothetical protein
VTTLFALVLLQGVSAAAAAVAPCAVLVAVVVVVRLCYIMPHTGQLIAVG